MSEPGLRGALDRGYAGAALALLALAALAIPAFADRGIGVATILVTAAVAATTGGFEYAAAVARALFLNGAYARLVAIKNLLGLGLMVAAGWYFGSAIAVLAAFALSTFVATLSVGSALRHRDGRGHPARARLLAFARYGGPIVAANLAYQAIVLLNRVVATATLGFAETGQLSLATDVTIRIFLSAGAALDVYLFQQAVRTGAEQGEGAARRQIARNMLVVAGLLLLGAVGFVGAMPAFVQLVVPAAFRSDFLALAAILTPGILAFCLVQFALNPIFQLAGRTAPIGWAALAALLADAALLLFWPGAPSVERLAAIHTASLLAGFAVALAFAIRLRECWPPDRDWAGLFLAALAALLAVWPTRLVPLPSISLGLAVVFGTAAYIGILLARDVGGCRALLPPLKAAVLRAFPTGSGRATA